MSYDKFGELFESASTKNDANSRSKQESNSEATQPEYFTKDAPTALAGVTGLSYDRLKELRDAPNNTQANNPVNNQPSTEESICCTCCTLI